MLLVQVLAFVSSEYTILTSPLSSSRRNDAVLSGAFIVNLVSINNTWMKFEVICDKIMTMKDDDVQQILVIFRMLFIKFLLCCKRFHYGTGFDHGLDCI